MFSTIRSKINDKSGWESMSMTSIVKFTAIGCFWMFSSESLVLVGNSSGHGRIQSIMVMLFLTLIILHGVYFIRTREVREEEVMGNSLGGPGRFLTALGFSGIIGTALFVSTGILVTAGYTFNEVFYYRFPNFGFAFLLLAAALTVQYFSEGWKNFLIGLLVLATIVCIMLLAGYGLFVNVSEPSVAVTETAKPFYLFLPLLFVFLGFEQTGYYLSEKISTKTIVGVLIATVGLVCGWMFVSAKFVTAERLMFSTIPHMTTAGKILDPGGRYIMGVAVICSSLAVVSMFFTISRTFFARHRLVPIFSGSGKEVPLFLALIISSLMIFGVAGTDRLEHLIRASLVMWMLYSGTVIVRLSLITMRKRVTAVAGLISGGTIVVCCLLIVVQHDKMMYLKMLPVFFAVSVVSVLLLEAICRHRVIDGDTITTKEVSE